MEFSPTFTILCFEVFPSIPLIEFNFIFYVVQSLNDVFEILNKTFNLNPLLSFPNYPPGILNLNFLRLHFHAVRLLSHQCFADQSSPSPFISCDAVSEISTGWTELVWVTDTVGLGHSHSWSGSQSQLVWVTVTVTVGLGHRHSWSGSQAQLVWVTVGLS